MHLVRRESNDGKLLYNCHALITGTFNTKGLTSSTLHDYLTTLQRMLAFSYSRKYVSHQYTLYTNEENTSTHMTIVGCKEGRS